MTNNPFAKLAEPLKYDAVTAYAAHEAVVAYEEDTPPLPPFMAYEAVKAYEAEPNKLPVKEPVYPTDAVTLPVTINPDGKSSAPL